MNLPAILPDSFLRCLTTADRKQLVGGAYNSPEEALRKSLVKSERQLQSMIVNLLRLKGIEPLWHRTDKKSAATIGWPDITFAAQGDQYTDRDGSMCCNDRFACAWEIKFGNGRLSKEQQQMHIRLSTPPNSWRVQVIRSVDEALAELKELGL